MVKHVITQLYEAREKVAHLVLMDSIYLPIFERLEREIEIEEAKGDAIRRARSLLERHKAIA